MADEAGRFTAEHTVMDKDLEIRELKHILEVKEKRIKELNNLNEHHRKINGELRQEIKDHYLKINGESVPKDVDYTVAEEAEDEFTEQLSFSFKQE